MTDEKILLQVSDWNQADRWYEVKGDVAERFRIAILKGTENLNGVHVLDEKVLNDCWTELVADRTTRRCDTSANHLLPEFFFDYLNPVESVRDWTQYTDS